MNHQILILLLVFSNCFLFQLVAENEFTSKGEIAFENRFFKNDRCPETEDYNSSLFSRMETSFRHGFFTSSLRVIARIDKKDNERSIFETEELWLACRFGAFQIKGGISIFNWSTLEAFHPIDFINSKIIDSSIDHPDKLGEYVFKISNTWDFLVIDLFLMPRFKSPIFPSSSSRLNVFNRNQLIIKETGKWINKNGEIRSSDSLVFQGGGKLTSTFGSFDVSIFFVNHIDRNNPIYVSDLKTNTIAPLYQPADKTGGSLIFVLDDLLLKAEWINIHFNSALDKKQLNSFQHPHSDSQLNHQKFALGLEKNVNYFNGHEGNFLLEFQSISKSSKDERIGLDLFQNDLCIGYRHSWNDINSKELINTLIIDCERDYEFFLNLRYQQRLNDQFKIKASIIFFHSNENDSLDALEDTSRLTIELIRYF